MQVNFKRKKSKEKLGLIFQEIETSREANEIETELETSELRELTLEYLKKDDHPYRLQLLEEFENGAELTGENGIRRKLGAFDLAYFGRAYLPHYFNRKSPKFHEELDDIWFTGVMKGKIITSKKVAKEVNQEDGCNKAIEAPRGHAKSTNFTLKDGLHAIVYAYKNFIIIISDTYDQASGFLVAIKDELELNEALIKDFGMLKGSKCWREDVILTSNYIKIQAKGASQKMRGLKHKQYRPDLMLLDDIENDENVRTKEQRDKLNNWFTKAVLNAGDIYTDVVYIGTLLHYDSLLAKVTKNADFDSVKYKGVISFAKNQGLWDEWEQIYTNLENKTRKQDALLFFNANKSEMLEDTKVLWEEKNSYYKLMCQKIKIGIKAFNSEIQNEPVDPDSAVFNLEWFDYYNEFEIDFKSKDFVFIGAVDPSLGKNKKSDTSAIIVLAKNVRSGFVYVAFASVERRKPDNIIKDIIEFNKRLKREFGKGFSSFGVETVQFQHFFKTVLVQRSAEAHEYVAFEEISQSSNKQMRIESLEPHVKNGFIKFNKYHKTLLEQMENFPMGGNDDAPDALEMAYKLAINIGSAGVDYVSAIKRKLNFKKGAY